MSIEPLNVTCWNRNNAR